MYLWWVGLVHLRAASLYRRRRGTHPTEGGQIGHIVTTERLDLKGISISINIYLELFKDSV